MRTLVWAELRGAWSSWLAVLIAFIATSFAIVLALLLLDSMTATIATGQVPAVQAPALQFIPAWNLALAAIGTLSVIGAVTGLVVQSRRGALARLSLAGATPGQVSRIVLAQLLIVSVGGAVLGILFAIALQPAAMQMILGDRGVAAQAAVIRVSPLSIAIGSIGFVLFALLAGLRQAPVAAAIAPVEALRAASGVPNRRRGVARWIGAGLLTLAIIGLAVGTTTLAPELGPDGADSVLQVSVICMLLSGAVLSLCAPLTVGLLTRAWTALIPSRSAPWVLARAAVIAKGERLARTVTPIALTIGLLVGLGTIVASTVALLAAIGHPGIEGTTLVSMLVLIALVLIVSISGGISVVLMMSRQREAELALAGVAGATPRQQVLITVFEGVIISITATLLGLVMTAVGMAVFISGLAALGLQAPFVVPWGDFAGVTLVCAAIVIAATTLPILRSLRRPARQVVAQLAAE